LAELALVPTENPEQDQAAFRRRGKDLVSGAGIEATSSKKATAPKKMPSAPTRLTKSGLPGSGGVPHLRASQPRLVVFELLDSISNERFVNSLPMQQAAFTK